MNTIKEILEEELALVEAYIKFLDRRRGGGILYIPDELATSVENTEDDESFEDQLLEALVRPVEDRWSAAAAIVPIIIRGPAEFHDKVNWIDTNEDLYKTLTARAYKIKAQIEEFDKEESHG